MNHADPRFDLIRRCHDGSASPEDSAQLEAHLRADPLFRTAYVRYIRTDLFLGRIASDCPETKTVPLRSANLSSSWRWITAMAAGLVLGMFTTSLIFAFSERGSGTPTQLTKLVDGGFEQNVGRIPSGFPTDFGRWSGDESEVVRGETKGAALRFVRAERESLLSSAGAGACDVFQLIDLSALKHKTSDGEAALALSVRFRDARREGEGETVRFIARISLFAGSPNSLQAQWPLNRKEALAVGSNQVDSPGGSPDAPIRLTANVFVPPQADFALVHLVAHKPDFKAPESQAALFGEAFVEDVQLTLKTPLGAGLSVTRR